MLSSRQKYFRLGLRQFSTTTRTQKIDPWSESTFSLDTSFGEVRIEWGQHTYRQCKKSIPNIVSYCIEVLYIVLYRIKIPVRVHCIEVPNIVLNNNHRGPSDSPPPLLVLPASEFSYKIFSDLPNQFPRNFCSRCPVKLSNKTDYIFSFKFLKPDLQVIWGESTKSSPVRHLEGGALSQGIF